MIQTATKIPTDLISEEAAWQKAVDYVNAYVGELFKVANPRHIKRNSLKPNSVMDGNFWAFDLLRSFPDLDTPVLAGRIQVEALTGELISLSNDQIWDIRARSETRAEHKRGRNPARGDDGLVLPYQAKIKVNAYMGGYVAFFSTSDGQPIFISNDPPIWRVETVLRLRLYGKIANLGTLDVNAKTGEVIPLSEAEIQSRQKRAEDAAITAKYAAASRR